MTMVDSINYYVNYASTNTMQTVTKVATNPSATKKLLQIISKGIVGFDLYEGKSHCPELLKSAGGTIETIGFYGTAKNIVFWINPFSKDTMDQAALRQSLENAVSLHRTPKTDQPANEEFTKQIFADLMKQRNFLNRSEVITSLKEALKGQDCEETCITNITNHVTVQQKSRPISLIVSSICFTTTDLVENILTLRKWGIIDLAAIGAQMGNIPVFAAVMNSRAASFLADLGIGKTMGIVATIGLTASFGGASYRFVVFIIQYYKVDEEKVKDEIYKEIRSAGLDMLSSGTDLAATALPLIFAINLPVTIGLSIVAKTTGFVIILFR